MPEKALALPFEATEIIDILCEELRTRLTQNCHLQGRREYASFKAAFDVNITLRTVAGESVDTLAWAKPYRDPKVPDTEGGTDTIVAQSEFQSQEPNAERMARGMPLTVEDKKGNRRKVKVSDAEAVSK